MPAVARKDGTDTIATNHGCDSTTVTDEGSSDVFINGIGAVREGDLCASHTIPVGSPPVCVPHTVPLSTFSSTVFVNGRGVGRLGDAYNGHILSSGSPDVFAGG
jgi:uncharacterized Zn-binding protein involved in type VI secretion